MKLTRHNGRSGKHGTYNPKHNDRTFDVSNSEHIDEERAKHNVYWDCFNGYRTFAEKQVQSELAARAYIHQMWAEAMAIYRSGDFKLRFSPTMNEYLKAHQREFMPEDTKAGQILDYLDSYKGNAVCSKQLYREALGHEYDEPKQWELREINDIMNNVVKGWKSFSNPRHFPKPYLRQKGWERELPDNGEADNGDGKFIPLSDAELKQMELPEGWR